jgi:polysaccharide deacetylase 2 family uncharacterized protein YibQ
MFFDSHAFGTDKAREVAQSVGIPFASSTLTLDERHPAPAVDGQLAKLVEAARRDGQAIGVGGAYPATIERIAAWANGLDRQGIALAPLTAVTRPVGAAATATPVVQPPAAPSEPAHAESPDAQHPAQ